MSKPTHPAHPDDLARAQRMLAGDIVIEQGRRNGDRFETYINVSARVGKTYPLRMGSLTWYVEVFNLLSQENPDMVIDFRLRQRESGELFVACEFGGGPPIFPSFGVVWKF